MKVYMACIVGIIKSNINNCIYFKNNCWETWNTILFVKHTITHFQGFFFFLNSMYLFYFVHKNNAYNNIIMKVVQETVLLSKLKLKVSSFLNKKVSKVLWFTLKNSCSSEQDYFYLLQDFYALTSTKSIINITYSWTY